MDLKESVREYLGLKTDAFKLGLIENLTMVINQLLVTIVLILTLMTALIFMAAGANKWLGLVLDNQVMASFITGGFFLLVFLVLFLYRKKTVCQWFRTTFLQTFF
jgi:CBS domain containing-hemolysin-like protein